MKTSNTHSAQVALLGGMCAHAAGHAMAARILKAEMLSGLEYQTLFAAIGALRERGKTITQIALTNELIDAGAWADGGAALVERVLRVASPPEAVEPLAEMIREAHFRRLEMQARGRIARVANDATIPADRFGDQARTLLRSMHARAGVAEEVRLVPGPELFATQLEPIPYLVDTLIARARQGVLYGAPGLGKSMCARVLAGAVATGEQAFGAFSVARGKVLWITAEESTDELKRGFVAIAKGCGYDVDALAENLLVMSLRDSDHSLEDPADRAWVERLVAEHRPNLVVLDSLASLTAIDLKQDHLVIPILRWGARMSSTLGTTCLWIAHDRKSGAQLDLNALLGGRQVGGQVDFAYFLTWKKGNQVVRCTKMRGAPEPRDVCLVRTTDGEDSYSLRVVPAENIASNRADGSPSETEGARRGEAVVAIRSYLRASPAMGLRALRDSVQKKIGIRGDDVGKLIHALISEGLIRNTGSAGRFQLHWVEPDEAFSPAVPQAA